MTSNAPDPDNYKPDQATVESLNEELSDEDLSGPRIDRRTSLKLISAAGLASIAGCTTKEVNNTPAEKKTQQSNGEAQQSNGSDTQTSSSGSSQSKAKMGGTLKAGWLLPDLDELDPPYIDHSYNIAAMVNIFDAMVKIAPDGSIVANLAKDWTVDGTTFTFQLRKGVTFHNGDDFTADDVKYTITRTFDQDLPAKGAISNLKDPKNGGVVAKDDYTVDLNWKKPYAPALAYLTRRGRAATVVNKNAIKKLGDDYSLRPIGTGPFKVTKHVVREKVVLERFDDYYATDGNSKQLPYLDGVTISLIPEVSTATSAFQSQSIDFLQTIPPQSYEKLDAASNLTVRSKPLNAWRGLEMNETKAPFDSPKFRLGIAKLIDTESFVEQALFGQGQPAVGPLAKSYWPRRDSKPATQDYDPEKGKQLIKDSGHEGVKFKIMGRSGELRWSKILRQMLNKSGVIQTEVNQVTGAQSSKLIDNMEYDTWIGGAGGHIDPDGLMYNFYTPDGIWNWTGYDNDTVTNLLNKQRTEMDRDKRAKLVTKLEHKLMKDAPHAYLFHSNGSFGMQTYVSGFKQVPSLRPFHTTWMNK